MIIQTGRACKQKFSKLVDAILWVFPHEGEKFGRGTTRVWRLEGLIYANFVNALRCGTAWSFSPQMRGPNTLSCVVLCQSLSHGDLVAGLKLGATQAVLPCLQRQFPALDGFITNFSKKSFYIGKSE